MSHHSPALASVGSPESQISKVDGEQVIVQDLIQAARIAGVRADPRSIVGFYVTLKSHATAILVGPKQSGKIAMVRSLAEVLVADPTLQHHEMVGHARWASNSRNITFFVYLQEQFNTNKLLAMIEEAILPQNANRLFIACLKRISPAELVRYFSAPGFQFWPTHVLPKDGRFPERPIPYPPNLRLIGTLDSASFRWWDSDLLSHAAVLPWTTKSSSLPGDPKEPTATAVGEEVFLRACIRRERAAYAKLCGILRTISQPFLPLMLVLDLLHKHGVEPPNTVTKQAIIFLANAWSNDGTALFDESTKGNLKAALDMALAHYVLPWVRVQGGYSRPLHRELHRLLDSEYVRAADTLSILV